MGVPKFYRWVSERYPCLSQMVSESQVPEFDNLYLDMNGIIHNCSHPDDDDIMFRISEEQIFNDVCNYIDMLFKIIRPKRVFFMAIDGVAPRAKMNQQRARRFMSARNAEVALAKAVMDGAQIPEGKRFDSNCITPGTQFMDALHKHIDAWINRKIETDPLWRQDGKLRVILSGHDCPGEGEHKIMDFIRAERASTEYDANTRHCMYGLDADLMMLGLSSHEPHFSLLREEVKFGRVRTAKSKNKGQESVRKEPKNINFHLLHLQLFREYLGWEFQALKDKLQFPFDLENIIDDWVLMGFLIGNDFIPHLPNVHIHSDALPLLYKTYIEIMPKLDGYLNEKGILNLGRFEKFLLAFSDTDRKCFIESLEDQEFMASKKANRRMRASKNLKEPSNDVQKLAKYSDSEIEMSESDEEEETLSNAAFVSSDEEDDSANAEDLPVTGGILSAEDALNAALDGEDPDSSEAYDPYEEEFQEKLKALQIKDMDEKEFENNVEKCWSTTINNAFKRHRRQYYKEKLKFGNISKDELKAQAEGYIRALQWNLHYYYHGCVSWNWFYPFHYSPYISDLINFHEVDMNFELSTPFRPFEQLLAVLPAASSDCLPFSLQQLMKDPNSPIIDFYPTDFETDLNGKINEWEAVVLVPFINQERLLSAIQEKENTLSNDEKRRNTHGPHIMYTCDISKPEGKRAKRMTIDKDAFRIERANVLHGLLPGVKLDVHFPGFPTMCHIPHTASLDFAGVKVFNTGKSKKESIILKPEKREEFEKPAATLAEELLDKQVYIDWPMLSLALVGEIWSTSHRYYLKDGTMEQEELNLEDQADFKSWSGVIREHQMGRYAIDIGPINYIVFCRKFLGLSITVKDGVVKRQKQWGSSLTYEMKRVALQVLVSSINVDENRLLSDIPITEAYSVNSKVFVMQPQWDGFANPAIVTEILKPGTPECRIVVRVNIYSAADVKHCRQKQNQLSLYWGNTHETGRRSGIGSRLLTRITGTVYLITASRETYEERPHTTPRFNIGLNLKLTKQNKEVPDFSRRNSSGYWEFSLQAQHLLTEYKNKFRDLFMFLEKADDCNEVYFAEDVWPEEERRTEQVAALKEYLKEVPTASIDKIECGSDYLDSQCIGALEKVLPKNDPNEVPIKKKSNVNPAVLYRYVLTDGKVLPDPEADFRLFDRVAYVVEGASIPCGLQGTIIGLIEDKLEVLFDRPFSVGYRIRSSLPQCYSVTKSQVINITFGKERKGKDLKKLIPKVKETTSGAFTKWTPRRHNESSNTTTTTKVTEFVPRILKHKASAKNENKSSKKNEKPIQIPKTEDQPLEPIPTFESMDHKSVELALNRLLGIGIKKEETKETPKENVDVLSLLSFLKPDAWDKTQVQSPSSEAIATTSHEVDTAIKNDNNNVEEAKPLEVQPSNDGVNESEKPEAHTPMEPQRDLGAASGFRGSNSNRRFNHNNNFRGRNFRGRFTPSNYQRPQFSGHFGNQPTPGYFDYNSTHQRGSSRGAPRGYGSGGMNDRQRQGPSTLLNNSDLIPSTVTRPKIQRGKGKKLSSTTTSSQEVTSDTANSVIMSVEENQAEAPTSNKPRKSRLAANLSSS